MKAANRPAPDGKGFAPFTRALPGRRGTQNLLEGILSVHGGRLL